MKSEKSATLRVHPAGADDLPAVTLLLDRLRAELLLPAPPADYAYDALSHALKPPAAGRPANVLLGFSGSRPTGVLIAEAGLDVLHVRNTLRVSVLYVVPTARRQGMGTALMRHLARDVVRHKISALYFSLQNARRETIGFADYLIGACNTPRELYLSNQMLESWQRKMTLSQMRIDDIDEMYPAAEAS